MAEHTITLTLKIDVPERKEPKDLDPLISDLVLAVHDVVTEGRTGGFYRRGISAMLDGVGVGGIVPQPSGFEAPTGCVVKFV